MSGSVIRRTPEMDARDAEIIHRRQSGQSNRDIARTMSLRRSVVSNVVRIARTRGVNFPPGRIGAPPRDNKARDDAVLADYRAGMEYKAIADKNNLPLGTIGTIITRYSRAGVLKLRTHR